VEDLVVGADDQAGLVQEAEQSHGLIGHAHRGRSHDDGGWFWQSGAPQQRHAQPSGCHPDGAGRQGDHQ